jgi:hypothetical protein
VRLRLAPLLPEEDFRRLIEYYDMVPVLQHQLRNLLYAGERNDQAGVASWSASAHAQLNEIEPRERRARETIQKYIAYPATRRHEAVREE